MLDSLREIAWSPQIFGVCKQNLDFTRENSEKIDRVFWALFSAQIKMGLARLFFFYHGGIIQNLILLVKC